MPPLHPTMIHPCILPTPMTIRLPRPHDLPQYKPRAPGLRWCKGRPHKQPLYGAPLQGFPARYGPKYERKREGDSRMVGRRVNHEAPATRPTSSVKCRKRGRGERISVRVPRKGRPVQYVPQTNREGTDDTDQGSCDAQQLAVQRPPTKDGRAHEGSEQRKN